MKIALKKTFFFFVALTLTVLAGEKASAQSASTTCDSGHCNDPVTRYHHGTPVVASVHYGYRVPRVGYGYRPFGYDHRYGTAEVLRASAQANLLNSHARTQNARAAQIEMQNSVEFLATRLERKRINKQSRFGHLRARGQQVQQAKLVHAIEDQPVRRPAVDAVSGRVEWPMLLRSTYFAKARRPIDIVFGQRSESGRINPDHFLPMRDWIELIECELKANVAYYELEDYLEAKSFLRELVQEARVDLDTTPTANQLVAQTTASNEHAPIE